MIFVMVKVPSSLSGASLLGVHNWVKDNIARTNPGASPDYTVTDGRGNRLTLSDIARSAGKDVNIEVVTINGVRKNPASNLTMIPDMQLSYPDLVRTGNNLTDLLPDEIDGAMATRIVAEQGLHRGLHTLNRMSLSTYNKNISSPTTAALLQMGEIIKKNPSDRTPFTQRTPVHYGSEKALQSYLLETSGADKISVANTMVEDAKIAARYGLNTQDIEKFAQEVLSDYLFAASANRGLLRTLVRNLPELKKSRETIQKLVYMFPQQPQSFYDGSQRVFVANTAFIYPVYAESLLSKKDMKAIVKFAEGYPRSMGTTDRVPTSLKKLTRTGLISPRRDFRLFLTQLITFGREASDRAPALDLQYRERGHLQTVIQALSADPRMSVRRANFRPLSYFSDLGGFYPSPPPKWPRKLMYAIMDGFLENLPHIINMEDPTNSNLTPVQMAYFSEPVDMKGTIQVEKVGEKKKGTLTVKQAQAIVEFDPKSSSDFVKLFMDLDGVKRVVPNEKNLGDDAIKQQEAIEILKNNIKAELEALKDSTLSLRSELTFDASKPKSVLEMVYDIAEIATAKYDYNMRGDDFKFTMAMVHYSFNALAESTVGDMFSLENRIDRGIANILGLDKFNRLEKLRDSIQQNEFDEGPRAAFVQSTMLAQLMTIRDEMERRMSAPMTDATETSTKEELSQQYRRIIQGLEGIPVSPSFNAGMQTVLTDMRNIIEGYD